MRDIGFTAARAGLTERQADALRGVFRDIGRAILHHGDCEGGDAQGHAIARRLGWSIVLHPPEVSVHRAFCDYDDRRPAAPFLFRNQAIVDETWCLIACPSGPAHRRSGTWATIRKATTAGLPVTIVWPDGAVEERRGMDMGDDEPEWQVHRGEELHTTTVGGLPVEVHRYDDRGVIEWSVWDVDARRVLAHGQGVDIEDAKKVAVFTARKERRDA